MRREVDEGFAAYVRERGDHLLRVAVLLTGDWHAAEDLVQASLMTLYRAWPRLDALAVHGDGEPGRDHVRGLRAPGLGEPATRQPDVGSPEPVTSPAAGLS
jgi:hypothetical protein